MKVLSTDGLTKLIELIKNGFISVDDTVTTSTVTLPNIATSVSASSTNAETVGAKLFYDTCGNIESLINAL